MPLLRRDLIVAAFAACTGAGFAQDARPLVVGVLVNGAPGAALTEFARKSLQDAFAAAGLEPGRNVELKFGYAEGKLDRLPSLAKELVAANVDMLFALGGPASRAAASATDRIPVVFSIVTDPVALGLVASMEAPGRNVTGVTNLDRGQAQAQMALLKEAAPRVKRIAILSDADIPGADASGAAPIDRDNLQAAAASGFEAKLMKLKGPTPDFDAVYAALANEGVEAIVALEVPVALFHRERIAKLAASHKMVSLFPGGTADAGGVLTYGTTVADTWSRMPVIAQRIFKGAAPGALPVETITRRELVVNLKTARSIGLELPPQILNRATRTID